MMRRWHDDGWSSIGKPDGTLSRRALLAFPTPPPFRLDVEKMGLPWIAEQLTTNY